MSQRCVASFLLVALCSTFLSAQTFVRPSHQQCPKLDTIDREIVLNADPGKMKFDKESFTVKPGERIRLTLRNPDEMAHNLVLCAAGDQTWLTVAQAAWAMGADGLDKGFIPDSPLVLHHTKLLNPHESDSIDFIAPTDEGAYPYVCTFPGHAFTMRGEMLVGSGAAPVGNLVSNLKYRYYEGSWGNLPDFDKLTPAAEGAIDDNRITLKPRKREDDFGFVYEATLTTPRDGTYRFVINSDDGSRVLVDGKRVVDFDGSHPANKEVPGSVKLTAGAHALRVEYFEGKVDQSLAVQLSGPGIGGVMLTDTPLRAARKEDPNADKYKLVVMHEALVVRGNLPDTSSRSMAVGLPVNISYVFDAENCAVRYGWWGAFLDVGPDRGFGTGRGGGGCKPLGDLFTVGSTGKCPLTIGDAEPVLRFNGYRRTHGHHGGPTFMFNLNGVDVEQSVAALDGKLGLQYTFTFARTPDAPVKFSVKPDGLDLASSAGAFDANGVLTVAPAAAHSFTVTLTCKEAK